MSKSHTPHPILTVSKLHFSYGEKAVLKNVSFKLKEGETLGIIGESGSGKTSLLKVLGGLLKPNQGQLLFDGNPIPGPAERLIAGHDRIRLVHQDFDLMPYLSVKENVLRNSLSESNAGRERVLRHFQKQLKLKEVSANRAADTSGGQKQRIAMATAISAKPDVLLLDEPFSNLDYPLKAELIHLLKTEWKPRAMIIVTHEPSDILQMADRLLVMHKGKIVLSGTAQEVYQHPKNEKTGKLLGALNTLSPREAELFGITPEREVYLRPHQFAIGDTGVEGEVRSCRFLGSHYSVEVVIEGITQPLVIAHQSSLSGGVQAKVSISG